MAAAGAAITAALVRRGLSAVDEQAKLARQLDSTQGALAGYQRAAEDAGVSSGVATRAAERLGQRLGEALRDPTSRSAQALDRLGLSAEDLQGLNVDERMARISDAMRDAGLNADQMGDELRQLGIRQGEVVRLMQAGGDTIRAASQDMEDFGVAVSDVDAAAIESANDSMSRISDVIQGIANQLAVQLAPLLEDIADRFQDASRESQGFGETIANVVSTSIDVMAFVADAIEGIRRAFVVAGQAAATLALRVRRNMMDTTASILEGPVDAINRLIETANMVPGIDFGEVQQPEIAQAVRDEVRVADRAVDEGFRAMQETLMEPMPGDSMRDWAEGVQAASRQAAERTVSDRERERGQIRDLREQQREDAEEIGEAELQDERERRMRNLENVRDFLRSEREQEQEAHRERMDWLREAHDEELITEHEFREKKEELEREHQERLDEILRSGEERRSDEIGRFAKANRAMRESQLGREAAALRSGLGQMFGDHKAFGEALGALKKFEAIQSAYAWGASIGGPPAGAAAAAAAGAAQAANLSNTQGVSMGGGGSGGGGSGGGGSSGGGGQQPIRAEISGLDSGQLFSGDQVGSLLDRLDEEAGDRGLRLTVSR